MAAERDPFGETMKLAERAKEDIYFAERDRELLEKLRAQLQKVDKRAGRLGCPKCPGALETYSFQGFILDRCEQCGGIWLDKGELEDLIRKVTRGPFGEWIERLASPGIAHWQKTATAKMDSPAARQRMSVLRG